MDATGLQIETTYQPSLASVESINTISGNEVAKVNIGSLYYLDAGIAQIPVVLSIVILNSQNAD